MTQLPILYPVFALAAWTSLVLLMIPIARFRAAFRREVGPEDFRYGESAAVPAQVSLPNRNYMNLLELPLLFYVVCLIIYVTGSINTSLLTVAWAYVALRVAHSLVHLTYNNVIHRLLVFATSNFVLVALWVMVVLHLTQAPVTAG